MPRYAPGQLPPGLTTLQQYLAANPGAGALGNQLVDQANQGIQGAKTAADQFVAQAAPGEFEAQTDQKLGVTPDQRAQAYKQFADTANTEKQLSANPSSTYFNQANPYGEVASINPGLISQDNQNQANTLQGNLNSATQSYNNLLTPGGVQNNLYQQFGKTGPTQYTGGDAALDSALVQGSGALSGVTKQDNSGYVNTAFGNAKGTDPLASYTSQAGPGHIDIPVLGAANPGGQPKKKKNQGGGMGDTGATGLGSSP